MSEQVSYSFDVWEGIEVRSTYVIAYHPVGLISAHRNSQRHSPISSSTPPDPGSPRMNLRSSGSKKK